MAAPAFQPLVPGGHSRSNCPPEGFTTTTFPTIYDDTIVVAACHVPLSMSNAVKEDGWFLSDFYAFNYLLQGAGLKGTHNVKVDGATVEVSGQTWLTAVKPEAVLDREYEGLKQQVLLHGNPYRDRRVVLSHELLDSGAYTPVTMVNRGEMKKTFVTKVKHASVLAKQRNAPLLLLVFCHGLENHELLLDAGQDRGLSPTYLKGAIEPGCKVTLITTACYSGGWVIHPDFNHTTLAAANNQEESNSWLESPSMGRTCGSIFVTTLIESLTSTTSALLPDAERVTQPQGATAISLQPSEPDSLQTNTYNNFCHSILDICRTRVHRLWAKQYFTFSAQDDCWAYSWTGRTGIPVVHFQARWDRLPKVSFQNLSGQGTPLIDPSPLNEAFSADATTHHLTASAQSDVSGSVRSRAIAMARLLLASCPNDWTKGKNVALAGKLRCFAYKGDESDGFGPEQVISIVQYRWDVAGLADKLVKDFSLPQPDGRTCVWFDWPTWRNRTFRDLPEYDAVDTKMWYLFRDHGFPPPPARDQGPPFDRVRHYLKAAIIEARLPEDESLRLAKDMIEYVAEMKEAMSRQAIRQPRVRELGLKWSRAVGKMFRSSSSPNRFLEGQHQRGMSLEEQTSS